MLSNKTPFQTVDTLTFSLLLKLCQGLIPAYMSTGLPPARWMYCHLGITAQNRSATSYARCCAFSPLSVRCYFSSLVRYSINQTYSYFERIQGTSVHHFVHLLWVGFLIGQLWLWVSIMIVNIFLGLLHLFYNVTKKPYIYIYVCEYIYSYIYTYTYTQIFIHHPLKPPQGSNGALEHRSDDLAVQQNAQVEWRST